MINNEDFAKRLKKVIEYYGESASSFAEKISAQRSSISHILSGRNKPSLDFVLKVLSTFPEVELYWLLNGKGEFPKTKPTTSTKTDLPKEIVKTFETHKTETNKTIERIVVFYSDGSFKNFEN
ncbi:MAG: helix-turn-helix transcriptional regulator [Algibacter sp.]